MSCLVISDTVRLLEINTVIFISDIDYYMLYCKKFQCNVAFLRCF